MSDQLPSGKEHCCDMMTSQINYRCPHHPDPRACPDVLFGYEPMLDEYGIYVRDGEGCSASSQIVIQYCPWCGKRIGSM